MTTSTRKPFETVRSEENNILSSIENIKKERIGNERNETYSHFSKKEELKTNNFIDFQGKIMMSENFQKGESEEQIPEPNKETRKESSEKPPILYGDNISIYCEE